MTITTPTAPPVPPIAVIITALDDEAPETPALFNDEAFDRLDAPSMSNPASLGEVALCARICCGLAPLFDRMKPRFCNAAKCFNSR